MMMTPQARRLITSAVRALPGGSRDQWGVWVGQGSTDAIRTDIPQDIAEIALRALVVAEQHIEKQLGTDGLGEDAEADLLNDLGYIQSIETALRT
jgi:hypothetical protein